MIKLIRIDPAQNMRRYYCISVQPDLFGGYILTREWGRVGKAGQLYTEHFPEVALAVEASKRLAEVKRRKGYR